MSDEARDNPFRFESFYYDSGVRTYDMRARSYRPEIGRFLTADRFEAAAGDFNLQSDPLTQNRYAFAGGNPVSNVEFDGHASYYDRFGNKYERAFCRKKRNGKRVNLGACAIIRKYANVASRATKRIFGERAGSGAVNRANALKHAFWVRLITSYALRAPHLITVRQVRRFLYLHEKEDIRKGGRRRISQVRWTYTTTQSGARWPTTTRIATSRECAR